MTLIIRAVNKHNIAFFSDGKVTSGQLTPENDIQKVFKNTKGSACVGISGFIKTLDKYTPASKVFNMPKEIEKLSNEENYIDSILNTTKTIYNGFSRDLDSIFLYSSIENGNFEHSVSKVIKEDGKNNSANISPIIPKFIELNGVKFDLNFSYYNFRGDLDEEISHLKNLFELEKKEMLKMVDDFYQNIIEPTIGNKLETYCLGNLKKGFYELDTYNE